MRIVVKTKPDQGLTKQINKTNVARYGTNTSYEYYVTTHKLVTLLPCSFLCIPDTNSALCTLADTCYYI